MWQRGSCWGEEVRPDVWLQWPEVDGRGRLDDTRLHLTWLDRGIVTWDDFKTTLFLQKCHCHRLAWMFCSCLDLIAAIASVGRPEPRIGVIVTTGSLGEFWFSVVLGVSHRNDHFCQRNHGRISFGFWDIYQTYFWDSISVLRYLEL